MKVEELSNEFDLLYNNIMSNQAPGLSEYEKSVFLTKAEYEIVKGYFSAKGNKSQEGFDDSGKRQIDFSMITVSTSLSKETEVKGDHFYNTVDHTSVRFSFPVDALMILNETLRVNRDSKNIYLIVVPISYMEYSRLMSKPYKYPIKNQAWRLLTTGDGGTLRYAELIAGPNDNCEEAKYYVRYLKRPTPIILEDLPDGLTIDGESGKAECTLDPEIHHEILQRAVELAKAAYIGDLNTQIALGHQSETNLGIVTQSR